jgi:GTPase SAR1 family protein
MATIKIPEQKVILCGEYGVGKSSLFRRFTNDTFVTATDRKSTLGLDHYAKTYRVSDRDLKVHPQHPSRQRNVVILAAIVGHRGDGARRLHHLQLLQVRGGGDFGLRP